MTYTPEEKALAGLLKACTTNPNAKKVLTAYSIPADHSTNIANISKFKEEVLADCADFFKFPIVNASGTKIYETKLNLSDRVILSIESFLPDLCMACEESYTVLYNDPEPPTRCFRCMQGSHTCKAFLDPTAFPPSTNTIGSVWLCKGCYSKMNPIQPSKKRTRKKTEPSDKEKIATLKKEAQDHAAKDQSDKDQAAKDQASNVLTDNTQANNTQADKEPAPAPTVLDRAPVRDKAAADPSQVEPPDKGTVCELFKKTRCPHGISGDRIVKGAVCSYRHPRLCKPYCRFGATASPGCSLGDDCEDYHPLLCKEAIQSKKCYNRSCRFTHIVGTQRRDPEQTSEQTREQPSAKKDYRRPIPEERQRARGRRDPQRDPGYNRINRDHSRELRPRRSYRDMSRERDPHYHRRRSYSRDRYKSPLRRDAREIRFKEKHSHPDTTTDINTASRKAKSTSNPPGQPQHKTPATDVDPKTRPLSSAPAFSKPATEVAGPTPHTPGAMPQPTPQPADMKDFLWEIVQHLREDFTKEMAALRTNLNTMNSQLLSLPPPTLRMEPLESSQYIHPSIASSSQTFTPNQSFLPSQSTLPHQQMLWRPSLPTCHQPVNHLQY